VKDAYYFSHDANARHDPKILKMISQYGIKGYGWYWIIVEMLREQHNYKLDLTHDLESIAIETRTKPKTISGFIGDCIKKFKLFKQEHRHFYSQTLVDRMKIMEEKREKRRKAAKTRWNDQSKCNAHAMHMHSTCNAIKGKESKENEIQDLQEIDMKELES
jgi:hypothetical protein